MRKINLAIWLYGQNGSATHNVFKKNNNFKLVALTENRLINKKFNGIKPDLKFK